LISTPSKEKFDKTLQVVKSIEGYHHVNLGKWSPATSK